MTTSMVRSNKLLKRMDSKKSHSWWWDSHISPKNSKWLAENLEEMDQGVKRMLKLIEEDADSFAKKAEMYYQKRPELISLVEQFYRMYRALAERYDNVTGELRKSVPSDLQSQGSGVSDVGSELPTAWPSPEPRLNRPKSGPRAAGFEFFLGSGGSGSDINQKEGDESYSSLDSEPESDDSSVNNYSIVSGNGGDQGLHGKITELEVELREAKEKLRVQQEESPEGSSRGSRNENSEHLLARIAGYEQELRIANENIRLSKEEISRLKIELQKCRLLEFPNGLLGDFESSTEKHAKAQEAELNFEMNQACELQEGVEGLETDASYADRKIHELLEELRIAREELRISEREIAYLKEEVEVNKSSEKISDLQAQLELAQKDVATWKSKLNIEKREVSKLQEKIARLKTSLSDRDHEIRDLKVAVSDAEQKIFPEKAQIKAEIFKLVDERTQLEEQLRDWESIGRSLEEKIRRIQAEKADMEERFGVEIEQLNAEIAKRGDCIKDLNESIDNLKSEGEELNTEVLKLKTDVISRDNRVDEMEKHLQQLHLEHVELIAGAEVARKLVEELRSKAKELEEEVEKQRVVILEGAEGKREAIRQLCFSIEHYRNGYHKLRQAFVGHNKRVAVFAS